LRDDTGASGCFGRHNQATPITTAVYAHIAYCTTENAWTLLARSCAACSLVLYGTLPVVTAAGCAILNDLLLVLGAEDAPGTLLPYTGAYHAVVTRHIRVSMPYHAVDAAHDGMGCLAFTLRNTCGCRFASRWRPNNVRFCVSVSCALQYSWTRTASVLPEHGCSFRTPGCYTWYAWGYNLRSGVADALCTAQRTVSLLNDSLDITNIVYALRLFAAGSYTDARTVRLRFCTFFLLPTVAVTLRLFADGSAVSWTRTRLCAVPLAACVCHLPALLTYRAFCCLTTAAQIYRRTVRTAPAHVYRRLPADVLTAFCLPPDDARRVRMPAVLFFTQRYLRTRR
jgi:hypothetical protein